MIANILIAGAFFVLGLIFGGAFVLREAMKQYEKDIKERLKSPSDPLIIRVYGHKE